MYGSGNSNNSGPQYLGLPPTSKQQILKFYDSGTSECQYYNYDDMLGFEKGSGKFTVYFKGARDVNAKDKVEITITGSTITITEAIEIIINAPLYLDVHKSTAAIIEIVSDTAGNSIRPEFTAASITYGSCCSGGGDTYTLEASTKAGSNVPLFLDAASGTDSTVNLTEGTNITLTRNSATQITIDSAATTVFDQINDHNIYNASWNVRDIYLIPVLDSTSNIFSGLPFGSSVVPGAFPLIEAVERGVNIQRATGTWDRITSYNLSMSSMTATAIAGLGTASQLRLCLFKASPADGDAALNFTVVELGDIDFNSTADRIEVNDQSSSITALSVGDLFFIGYKLNGSKLTGNITGLKLQTTARFWKS